MASNDEVPIYIAADYEASTPEPPCGQESDKTALGETPGAASVADAENRAALASGKSLLLSGRQLISIIVITALNCLVLGGYLAWYFVPHTPVVSALNQSFGMEQLFPLKQSEPEKLNVIAPIVARVSAVTVNIDVSFSALPESVESGAPRKAPPAEASGLIVRSDGYILTNAHVVKQAAKMKVTLADMRVFPAKLVGIDEFSDLAVIKIDASNLPVLPFAKTSSIKPGDWAIAVGSPLGFDHTVTLGVVSSSSRSLADFNNRVELIQHSAALNMGNSGGPLANIQGQIIGLNTAMRSGANGLGFATPAEVAIDVANQLIARGKVARPFMGIFMSDIDPERTRSLTLPSSSVAVKIDRVAEAGPAFQAGLKSGDIILKINGISVRSSREVRKLTADKKPGDTIIVVVLRGQENLTVKIVLGDYSKQQF